MAFPKEENRYIADLDHTFLAEEIEVASTMDYTHIHSVYEVYFCPAAIEHRCVISGNDYNFSYPAVILVKPYTIHSMTVTEAWPQGQRWYLFSFGADSAEKAGMGALLSTVLRNHTGLLVRLTSQQAAHLERIVRLFFESEWAMEESDSLALFSYFLRRLYSITKADQILSTGTADGGVQQIMQYICENFHAPLTSQIISEKFFVSRSKLSRDFKAAIGVTPKGFVELYRLYCAKNLLVTREKLCVSEIAQMCGFPSETYFYRFFRQHTGMTPTQYKNTVDKNRHI